MDTETESAQEHPEPEKVKVKLDGSGFLLDREVDIPTALDVMNVVLGGRPGRSVGTVGGSDIGGRRPVHSRMSVGEFIASSGASTNPEKIVAIGAWLEDETGVESFTKDQVKEQFQKAKHKTPSNLPRDWRGAIKSRWIAESNEEAGRHYVTNTGRNALESGFDNA